MRLARSLMPRLIALISGIAFALYFLIVEPRRLSLCRWRVRIDGLPSECEGLRVVLMSDIHVGTPLSSRAQRRRAVRMAVAERPDLIFLTGDFMNDGRWQDEGGLFRPLAETAPVFAVLGNHDHTSSPADTQAIVAGLEAEGVRMLSNAHAPLPIPHLPWLVVGVDDWATGHADVVRAVTGIVPHTRILALLTHVPDVGDHVPPGWFPLIVAGHTHGKRIRLGPLVRIPVIGRWIKVVGTRYPSGFYEVNGSLLYVTRGVGTSDIPLRAGSVPEVSVFELTGGAALPDGVRYQSVTN